MENAGDREVKTIILEYPDGSCTHIIAPPKGGWALTGEGEIFTPWRPSSSVVCFADIANALSRICRFNGHIQPDWPEDVYSVGQHTLLVARLVARNGGSCTDIRAALLHDAHEAYCHDIIQPMKSGFDEYRDLERRWEYAVHERFNLTNEIGNTRVKEADMQALVLEKKFVCCQNSPKWEVERRTSAPNYMPIYPMTHRAVRAQLWEMAKQFSLIP